MNERDYTIDFDARSRTAVIQGVLRLESVEAYTALFAPIAEALLASDEPYTVDLGEVSLMNSSGVSALANLVLAARRLGRPLTFIGSASALWFAKTVVSLKTLYAGLDVRAQDPR